jgi:imidazoleglycerol phosphate synthase glutamine amidotransferase subunit HisH
MQNIKSSINIVKSGVGNIGLILKAIDCLYYSSNIVNKPEDFNNSKKIIRPGVGSYDSFMSLIKNKKLFEKFKYISNLMIIINSKNEQKKILKNI